MASTPAEAAAAFTKLGGPLAVIKAQIHAGGRGKGSFIEQPSQRGAQLVRSAEEAQQVAACLGNRLVTIQSGAEGRVVHRVLVEEGCDIARELYLGIVLDRAASRPVLMASTEGGVEIEKVAEETPELILKEHFDPDRGLEDFQVRKLCHKLKITGNSVKSAQKFMKLLCRTYVAKDCSLAEINPLVVTGQGDLLCHAKMTFDDNGSSSSRAGRNA